MDMIFVILFMSAAASSSHKQSYQLRCTTSTLGMTSQRPQLLIGTGTQLTDKASREWSWKSSRNNSYADVAAACNGKVGVGAAAGIGCAMQRVRHGDTDFDVHFAATWYQGPTPVDLGVGGYECRHRRILLANEASITSSTGQRPSRCTMARRPWLDSGNINSVAWTSRTFSWEFSNGPGIPPEVGACKPMIFRNETITFCCVNVLAFYSLKRVYTTRRVGVSGSHRPNARCSPCDPSAAASAPWLQRQRLCHEPPDQGS